MPQAIPKLRVQFINGRDVFPSIICEECDRYPTQHRCLFEVDGHGYLFDGRQVCGTAVCSICSSSFGNEGIFTCAEHSSTKENERPAEVNNKENQRPTAVNNNNEKNSSAPWTKRNNKNFDAPVVKGNQKADDNADNFDVNDDESVVPDTIPQPKFFE
jgi:hypothetical protein